MANTLSACGHYGIYVALQHLCGSMCQEWSDAEPAPLSRCVERSDVPNASGMHRNFTCILWIYRSCPINKLSGCVSLLIRIEAKQCRERLQHATCIFAPQVSYASITESKITHTLYYSVCVDRWQCVRNGVMLSQLCSRNGV